MKRRLLGGAVVLFAVGGIAAAVASYAAARRAPSQPTVRVVRGTLDTTVTTEGELRTPRAVMLVAPPVGGSLQLVNLVRSGAAVKAGDVVFEFDPAEQEYLLEQAQYDLHLADQEVARLKADSAVQQAQDRVALLQARFAVRRAELDTRGAELVGAVEARKNEIALEEARRALAQLEEDIKAHAATNQASLAVLAERQHKARLAMDTARRNIENMKVRSPIDGLVVVRENQDASGGFFFSGMSLPDYRPGDAVMPGRNVAQVVDVGGLEAVARVGEGDRANLETGQKARIRVAGFDGEPLTGVVKSLGGLAARGFIFDTGSRRQFDVAFTIDSPDPRLRPGAGAEIVIAGQALGDVLYLPSQAIFEKDGKPVVYVLTPSGLEPREVKVRVRTASHVVV
ncbi:MAG: HlyD family efflux transporter periplasmic adaptor subunit, partial [Acidobacteria bacterium]